MLTRGGKGAKILNIQRVAIVVYIGFRYNAPTQFRYIHIYIHQI